ncbi:hypothetical protein KSF78_0003156 [Schistosoma japonicum]|nr:hypothetical protein KSF78_0003156 [Schistosoma japonicum]
MYSSRFQVLLSVLKFGYLSPISHFVVFILECPCIYCSHSSFVCRLHKSV